MAPCFLLSLPSRAEEISCGRNMYVKQAISQVSPPLPLPCHYLHLPSIFLELLLIPCLAGSRHQGKVQLPLHALQKKTIVVAGFSSSQFYFDFHIKKKNILKAQGKKSPCQQKSCHFLEESTATESRRQPGVTSPLSQHRQSSITPTPPCPGLAARGAGTERLGREFRQVFQHYSTPQVLTNWGFPRQLPGIATMARAGRTAAPRTGTQPGGHRHPVPSE